MSQFRSGGRLNRSGRTTADHDVFEGLPIRQWRLAEHAVVPPPQSEPVVDKDAFPELPMPKDSNLLPDHSQQLLRAARAGRTTKPAAAVQDEDKENEDADEDKQEVQRGYVVRRFQKVARHLEGPEVEYLAKRRKGLPSAHSSLNVSVAPLASNVPMRKTKVRKTDAEGNVTVWEVLVPEGQTVEGEVLESEAVAVEAAPAPLPGTVVQGVGVVNAEGMVVASETISVTPQRIRRPPPRPKKKNKGPGRGKKKVAFTNADGSAVTAAPGMIAGIPQEGLTTPTFPATASGDTVAQPSEGDTPMGEAQDGDEDDEDDEGDDVDEDSEHEDGELSQSPNHQPILEPPTSVPAAADMNMTDVGITSPSHATGDILPAPSVSISESAPLLSPPKSAPEVSTTNLEPPPGPSRDPSSSPELPLATVSHSRSGSLNQIPALPSMSVTSQADLHLDEAIPPPIPMEPAIELELPLEPQKTEIQPEPPLPAVSELAPEVIGTEAIASPAPIEAIASPAPIEAVVAAEPPVPVDTAVQPELPTLPIEQGPPPVNPMPDQPPEDVNFSDGEPDLLGSLERHLDQESKKPT